MNKNPFITSGYVSADYFCDREQESKEVIRDIEGRNNKVIISPRRMGKTGLILHCFQQPKLREHYYCFFIDIYSTLTLSDFIALLGNKICETLKPKGKSAVEAFCRIVRSLEFFKHSGPDDKTPNTIGFMFNPVKIDGTWYLTVKEATNEGAV